jgi:hypothetical protein
MTDEEFRDVQVDLMKTQIELYKEQIRWEPLKAIAAMLATAALLAGTILALSNWLHPSGPQTINVHLDAPLTVGAKP